MKRGTPPLNYLLAFEAAARLGSFSKSADELAVTQSAVSQRVQKLEEFVGQALFLRTGSGVRLTAAGEILAATVRETLDRLQVGLDRIEPYRNQDSVIVGAPADFAHGWLTPRLGALRAQAPGNEIWLVVSREVRDIDRIDMDLVVSRRPIHTADVECLPLLEDATVAICSPSLARRIGRLPFPKLLEGTPLLFLEDDPNWRGVLDDKRIVPGKLLRGATIDDARIMLDAVIAETGVACLSRVACQAAIDAGQVAELPQVPKKSLPRFWLMRSRLPPRTAFVDRVFAWLAESAAAGLSIPRRR